MQTPVMKRNRGTSGPAGSTIRISALAADAHLLSAAELVDIDQLMIVLAEFRTTGDAATIEAATQALAKGTEAFAAERMNHGIQQALAGKNIAAL